MLIPSPRVTDFLTQSLSRKTVISSFQVYSMFTFPSWRDKKRSMATSLIQLSDDVQPVVSAGDFTRDRTDLCWSDQESILAFIFMSIGCLFICLSILPALSHHPLYACIAFYMTCLLLSYTGWAVLL